ncbi:MAG: DUF2842 domain-containing protein [Amylibacter sp.]
MALSYKVRRGWSLVLLLIWLPLYIVVVVTVMNILTRTVALHGLVQFFLYVFFGFAWALPFKSVFKGIGQADPDADPDLD